MKLHQDIQGLSPAKQALFKKLLAQKKAATPGGQSIPKRDADQPIPLSLAQQRLWLLQQLEPSSAAYNIFKSIRMPGVRVPDLEMALNLLVNRHETLRTYFSDALGTPHQVIGPKNGFQLQHVDLRHLPRQEQEPEVQRLLLEERARPFDLATGPLLRATLLHVTASDPGNEIDGVLFLNLHHIIADDWSVGVLARELTAFYRDGDAAQLQPLAVQYGDYAAWQEKRFQGERLAKQLRYWTDRLADPTVLQIHTDRPRPPLQTFDGAKTRVTIEPEVKERLQQLARQENASLFMVLLTAYGLLLHRYSRQEDILIGVPISGRSHLSLEALIGFFVNSLTMRLDFSELTSFRDLLRRTRDVVLEAFEHQDLPIEKVIEAVQPKHDPSRSSLFQTMFVLRSAPRYVDHAEETAVMSESADTAQFDVSMSLSELGGGLDGSLEFNTDLFDDPTAKRMVSHFEILVQQVCQRPDQPLAELTLLSAEERHKILVEWNRNRVEQPRDMLVYQRVEAQAARTPHRQAYRFGEHQLTYGQANAKANALALELTARGVGPGCRVPVVLERGLEVPLALLAVMKAGAAFVPIDVRWPLERMTHLLEILQPKVILSNVEEERLGGLAERCLHLNWAVMAEEPVNPLADVGLEDPIYVMFTSGSTGTPKGAIVLHKGILNRLQWMSGRYGVTEEDVILQTTHHCFDSSIWQFFWPQMHGARTVMPERTVGLDPIYGLDLIAEENVTIADFVPAEFDALWHVLTRDSDGRHDLRSLRQLIIGGEAINVKTVFEFRRRYPWVEMVNSYGPTETSIGVLSYPVPETPVDSLPIGRPQDNVYLFVTDAENRPVPVGVPGELLIGGDCVGGGYLGDTERTDAAFIESPFPDVCGGRLYRTGDLVRYLDDGNVEFLGRIDHQIKIRGYRIEPGEIESRLLQHPQIREALVMAMEVRTGIQQLVAYVTGKGDALDPGDLRTFVGEALPSYMVPSRVLVLEALPMTANGKVHRQALPIPTETEEEVLRVPPQTPTEIRVAGLWCDLLGLDEVGLESDFFDLGGHSLLATRLRFALREAFEIDLPLQELFLHSTLGALAERLENELTVRNLEPFETALSTEEEELLI